MAQSIPTATSGEWPINGSPFEWWVPLESPLPVAVPRAEHVDGRGSMCEIGEVLTAWRAAERELTLLPEGSHEWSVVYADIAEFRASYHLLFQEHSRGHASPWGRTHLRRRNPREPDAMLTTTMTKIAPSVAMTTLSTLMPLTDPILSTLVAMNPPTMPPTMPRTIIISSPEREPMIVLARKPAIAPTTIHEMKPI
jgi:hypothetical protein